MSLITTSGLIKRYGSVLAVSDLTVDVAAGVVGLVGVGLVLLAVLVVGATWGAGRQLRSLRLTSDA